MIKSARYNYMPKRFRSGCGTKSDLAQRYKSHLNIKNLSKIASSSGGYL